VSKGVSKEQGVGATVRSKAMVQGHERGESVSFIGGVWSRWSERKRMTGYLCKPNARDLVSYAYGVEAHAATWPPF